MRLEDLPFGAREQIAAELLRRMAQRKELKERRKQKVSKPRYDDWSYVKGMVRRYPELKREYDALHEQSITARYDADRGGSGDGRTLENIAIRELPTTRQREYAAVHAAIQDTRKVKSGDIRLKIIDLVFWKKTHTLEGAAMVCHTAYSTAKAYHGEFLNLVAQKYGLRDL